GEDEPYDSEEEVTGEDADAESRLVRHEQKPDARQEKADDRRDCRVHRLTAAAERGLLLIHILRRVVGRVSRRRRLRGRVAAGLLGLLLLSEVSALTPRFGGGGGGQSRAALDAEACAFDVIGSTGRACDHISLLYASIFGRRLRAASFELNSSLQKFSGQFGSLTRKSELKKKLNEWRQVFLI